MWFVCALTFCKLSQQAKIHQDGNRADLATHAGFVFFRSPHFVFFFKGFHAWCFRCFVHQKSHAVASSQARYPKSEVRKDLRIRIAKVTWGNRSALHWYMKLWMVDTGHQASATFENSGRIGALCTFILSSPLNRSHDQRSMGFVQVSCSQSPNINHINAFMLGANFGSANVSLKAFRVSSPRTGCVDFWHENSTRLVRHTSMSHPEYPKPPPSPLSKGLILNRII